MCAMITSGSNDLFRNRLNLNWIRLFVLLLNVPIVVLALKNVNIYQLFLISDLVSASAMPPILLGLWHKLYFLNGLDIIVGGLGGYFTIFLFGLVYYKDAYQGANVLILSKSLYADDWSTFGAFVAGPVGSILWMIGSCLLRLVSTYVYSRVKGKPFTFFDQPIVQQTQEASLTDNNNDNSNDNSSTSGDSITQVEESK